MKKRAYKKPSMRVVELQHRTCLLQASGTPPNEIPDYDDWLGAREFVLDDDEPSGRKANGIWDGEEDRDE
ncbi:hypothetical protein [Prevotella communis]|nr:hypothetical protein [Prevotella communis]